MELFGAMKPGALRAYQHRETEIPIMTQTQSAALVPSAYQLAVYDDIANGTGNTVVNAVAGSGKTTTIVTGLKHVPVGLSTLFVAFNKSIAEELKTRAPRGVEVSTLHSYGLRCVTAALGRLTINQYRVDNFAREMHPDPPRTEGADEDLKAQESAKAMEIFYMRRDLAKVVSLAKGALATDENDIENIIESFDIETCPIEDEDRTKRDAFIADVLTLLARCTGTEDGFIDFDDMIWLPIVLNLKQRKYQRVFGDEIQDFNACQIELMIRALAPNGRFCGVGDPRQAIYGFRGADENAFDNVKTRLDARELPLSVCYRCAVLIVEEAQEFVPNIQSAPGAKLGDVRVVPFNEMKRNVKPGDFILSRTNAPLASLCMGFLAEGRRAIIQGRDVGVSLAAFVKKSKAKTIPELRSFVEEWSEKETARLAAKNRDTQAVEDRAACILALSDGAASVADVVSRIERLFADKNDKNCIVLSTTHKAKGMERDRVWMLQGTYRRRPGIEEENLAYVAITRAKSALFLVEKPKKSERNEEGGEE